MYFRPNYCLNRRGWYTKFQFILFTRLRYAIFFSPFATFFRVAPGGRISGPGYDVYLGETTLPLEGGRSGTPVFVRDAPTPATPSALSCVLLASPRGPMRGSFTLTLYRGKSEIKQMDLSPNTTGKLYCRAAFQ